MKMLLKSIVCLYLLNSVYYLQAQKTLFEFLSIEAALSANWQAKYINGTYVCYSKDETSAILIFRDDNNSINSYKEKLPYGVDLGEGILAQKTGQFIQLSPNAIHFEVILKSSNGNFASWGGMKPLKNGGVIGFLAISDNFLNETKSEMFKLLLSCEEVLVENKSSQEIVTWFNLLTSRQLEGSYDSYNSGYGSGIFSSSSYNFCQNKTYSYYYEYSNSLSYPTQTYDYGTWQITVNGDQAYLILFSNSTGRSVKNLNKNENEIILGDEKYLMTDYLPNCR